VDIIASPTTVTFNTQFGAPPPGASPGEVVEAKVLQVLADGRARLAVANTVIDVISSVTLTVGATVRIAVKHSPEGIRLSLLDPTHLSGAKSAVPLIVETSSRAALAAAFPAAAFPAAGAPVAAATAAANAGHGAANSTHVDNSAAMPTVPSPPLSPAATSAAALAQAVRGAAVRQSGLGPLFADLAVAIQSPTLPLPVRAAAAEILALRVPVADGLPAATLKQAVQNSGLFLEANLAVQGAAVDAPHDLKAALLSLRQVLKTFIAAEAGGSLPQPAAPSASPPAAPLAGSPPSPPSPAAAASPTPAASGPSTAIPAAVTAPNIPPPYRGAPTVAQPEPVPQITSDMKADDIARVLVRDTEGSLSRQTLLQAASVPERANHSDPASGPRWHFEIPFATPQGTTLAQFEISRDGHAAPAEGYKSIWRARFSVDVEPLGAVHAQVALIGERAAVTLWAERPDAAARIRDGAADLKAALFEAAFEPDILVRDGAPPRPREVAAPTGHFLDRAS
jgi:hypothetical protein